LEIYKFARITTVFLLAFSWLFMADAKGTMSPLEQAWADIQELDEDVNQLTDKEATQDLIDIAHTKYNEAYAAKQSLDSATTTLEQATTAESQAIQAKNNAIAAVDNQTPIVANALSEKNAAQDALDVANINLQTTQSVIQSAGGEGLQYTVYHLTRVFPNIAVPDSVICSGTWNSNSMQLPVCGYYENIIVKFTGKITVPSDWDSVYFAGYTDDGFRMYVDGNLAVNNWVEQGVRWSAYSPIYDVSQDKTLDVEIWWYNGGGPGSYHLGWSIPGGWTGAGCAYTGGWGVGFSCDLGTFSSGPGATQEQINAYNAAVTAKATAQADYNNKLATYNTENSKLQQYTQTKDAADISATNAISAKSTAQSNYNSAQLDYNLKIVAVQNAIDDAQESLQEQLQFENEQRVAAAIAQAMANQPQPQPSDEPQPSPEPSPEPSDEPTTEPEEEPTTEPTPEQTEPEEPNPSPSSDTTEEENVDPTPEPETSPEPETEPSPLPEDTDPTPETEPTQDPSENVDKTENTPIDNATANLIADLTNSNTLTKLTPEQAAVVSKALGVAPEELKLVAELAKSDENVAEALEEFGDRANENLDAPMPYTLADAVTEVQTEAFLADPLGAVLNIDPLELLSNFSELGMDMTDDQREKAQEVIIPVVLVSNIVSAVVGMRR
jgi:hypothetical protein